MAEVKVNFEIVSVHADTGVALVNYWCDGATKERFLSEYGPWTINLDARCATMTSEQLNAYVAKIGIPIVERQKAVLEAEAAGVHTAFQALVSNKLSVTLDTDNLPE